MSLRVLFDASSFEDLQSGVARRFLNLYSEMLGVAGPELALQVLAPDPVAEAIRARLPGAEVIPVEPDTGGPVRRLMSGNRRTRELLRRTPDALVHQDTWPLAIPERTIPCVHDLRWIEPEYTSRGVRQVSRLLLRRGLRRCPHVLTVSPFMRDQIRDRLGVSEDRITVVPNGIDVSAFSGTADVVTLRSLGLEVGGYRLFVGHREPRKNIPVLIRAQKIAADLGDSRPLVIAGRQVPGYSEPEQLTAQLGLEESVRFIEAPPDDVLRQLYRAASVFLMPSLYEGFGIPVLEAMAAGTPVLCSQVDPFPWVAGPRAFLPPHDAEAWARAIRELDSGSLRATAIEQGASQLRSFSWEAAARLQLSVYDRLR